MSAGRWQSERKGADVALLVYARGKFRDGLKLARPPHRAEAIGR